jgi:glycosyltransferase involved in cell wall biosynthesis
MTGEHHMRIGIAVVAYNAASTLAGVLDRIPPDFRSKVFEIVVSDDHSQDATYSVGERYRNTSDLPLTVIRQTRNLGYGGNQKACYRYAIERGFDIVVLLHGDGQYAPEALPEIVAPLERGEAEAVFGSRMLVKGAARQGGMPLYKFAGNRILSTFENAMLGTNLSEFHSGYRAYSVEALRRLQFERNADGFNFDTQIIIQLQHAGMRIVEVPIPTYYGDEICYVNGLQYAWDVTKDVIGYRLQVAGFGDGERVPLGDEYGFKATADSSHGRLLARLVSRPPGRILDLGCSGGALAQRLTEAGHEVTGVDVVEVPGVRDRMARFVRADLDAGIPSDVGVGYDAVLAADVLEHLRDPARLIRDTRRVLRPDGSLIACVPNIGHWYPRTRVALGLFGYDQRGPLDRGHLRFFTRRSIKRLVEREGFAVRQLEPVGAAFEVLGIDGGGFGRAVRLVDRSGLAAWPTFFGYQFILEADPRPEQVRSPSGDQDGERRDERDGAEEPDDLHRPSPVE